MHDRHDLHRSAPRDARRLPRRDRRRARARRRHPRPAAAQRRLDAAARPAPAGVRGARRGRRACASSCCARSASISPAAATSRASWRPRRRHVSKLAWNIAAPARCSKPVIAANRGYCFGVGFELSLACDFRIVSETCFYALPEQKLGQIPGSGGSARLQKIVGITRTKDIVMRSQAHSRQAGLRLGHRHRMRARRRSSRRRPTRWSMSCAPSRRSRSAPPRSCSTTPRMLRSRSRSSSKAIATAGCGNRTISARASRRSMLKGHQRSRANKRKAEMAQPNAIAVPYPVVPCKNRKNR